MEKTVNSPWEKYFGNKEPKKEEEVKLRYRLEKWEKTIVFQVLEMDERFRSGNESLVYESEEEEEGSFDVYSSVSPAIGEDAVYLWGEDNLDDLNVESITFGTNEERDKYFDKVQTALADWAENWEGFEEDSKTTKEIGKGVFEV